MAVLAVLVLLAVLLGVLTAEPGEDVEPFSVGSCVSVSTSGAVSSVDCDGPNTGRIVSRVDFPQVCPSGTTALPVPSRQLSLCLG